MRANRDNLLFYEGDLSATLRNAAEKTAGIVEAIPKDQFLATPEDRIIETVVSQARIEPLTIYEDRMTMEESETKIDVSEWRERNPFHDPGPIWVHGLEITVSLPYTGDPLLWKLKPDHYQLTFPRGTVQRPKGDGTGVLQLEFQVPTYEGGQRIKGHLDSQLKDIRFFVGAQSGQIAAYNNGLPERVRNLVAQRRQRIKQHDNIADMLGIPLTHKAGAPPIRFQ